MSHRARLRLSIAVVLLALALPSTGRAQGHGIHPLPTGPRPLHLRLGEADAVVLARVDAVETGRIHLVDGEALVGEVEAAFSVKRSPSRPPALEVGDRALLLLRGARSPYVLTGQRGAVVPLASDADAQRWSAALRELLEVRASGRELRALYLAWLDGPHADQREEAARALFAPDGDFPPVPVALALERARAAVDPERDPQARRVSALLALRREEGTRRLLEGLAAAGERADPDVFRLVLGAAAASQNPALGRAIGHALRHPDAKLRRNALAFAPLAWSGALAAQVRRLEAEDPDAGVRAEAARLRAARGSAGEG